MLKKKTTWKKRLLYVFGSILILLVIGIVYLLSVAIAYPPKPADTASLQLQRSEAGNGFYTLKNSWFRKSNSGLYELYVEGSPFEMGVINGKLTGN